VIEAQATEHVSITCDGACNEEHVQKTQAKTSRRVKHYTSCLEPFINVFYLCSSVLIGVKARPLDRPLDQKWIARPPTARADSFTASARVGWAWQARATSSLLAPNSIALAHSAIRSPACGPMMWTPRMRSVLASA